MVAHERFWGRGTLARRPVWQAVDMRALSVVPGRIDTAAVEERPEPALHDGDVLVEGLLMGVCATDVQIAHTGYGRPPPGRERLVLGHESLGRVLAAPEGCGLSVGDLVAGVVRRPDPAPCPWCAAGEWDMCANGGFVERGIKEHDGYGATRWRADAGFVIRVDPRLGDAGVLLEPTSVVAKAWEQVERIGARATFEPRVALVTGAGPIGLLAALLGVQRGLDVHVLDEATDGPKPGLVRDLGATYHSAGVAALGVRPDIVVEATGVGALVRDVLGHTAPNAIVALTGISSGSDPVEARLAALGTTMVESNQVVFGSVNAAHRHYAQAADALARADLSWLSRLITRRVPMSEWANALRKGPDDVKVVVDLQA